ncbi:MAG: nucleotidyltransferase domain-containing protein [Syntrophomonadaceae bacterium]|nr:nucleotidyltransferase domain-containing protein [Syntrophomonadaceae bacterium]
MGRRKILEEVKKIVTRHLRDTNAKVYLFGSWARGEETHSSDIDIGVWYEGTLPPGTLSLLRETLENSTIPYSVDLVDLTQTNSSFRESALKGAVLWSD